MANDPAQRGRWGRLTVWLVLALAVGLSAALAYLMHRRNVELVRALDSPDPEIVIDSLIDLKDRSNPAGVNKATTLLNSDNPDVRLNAALYLGSLGKPNSVPYLIEALGDVKDDQKDEIVSDLTQITGKSFGRNESAWENWWANTHPQNPFRFGDRPDSEP